MSALAGVHVRICETCGEQTTSLPGTPCASAKPLRATRRQVTRARMLKAKEDLALEALFAWYRGELTEAELREAAGDLVRALGRP